MKRPWSEDDFFCFECVFFGGKDRCRKFREPLERRPWDISCDKFQPLWRGGIHGDVESNDSAELQRH